VLPLTGKRPLIAGGVHAASRDPTIIEQWWRRWPHASIGIACGAPSGVVVIDIDVPSEVPELCNLQTLSASTPSGSEPAADIVKLRPAANQ
jgi:Bifunctional DNA primase/polymerase, N-terminal